MTAAQRGRIEEETKPFATGARTASAALLAWFLTTVWRLEPDDVEDSICDGGGDKGIDALAVDEDLREITLFQSKHRQKADAKQGDADLKNLVGAAAFFATTKAVDQLMRSGPNPELLRLLTRKEVRERVAEGAHATRLVFVTNGTLDPSGRDYVSALGGQQPSFEVWDQSKLSAVAERTRRPELLPDQVTLRAVAEPTGKTLEPGVEMAVALVGAEQLINLPGISDLSLFDRNVRLSLGRTRINRELAETVRRPSEHKLFPAYHNGLTILTHRLRVSGDRLHLDGITVVNGCQSLLALYRNKDHISSDLNVLVKVVQVGAHNDLTDKITYRTNNQNPVDIRDQRSTDSIQRDLQTQVREKYGTSMAFGIREGETFGATPVLDNQLAAQLITAVYLREPWNAVRKVRLFDEDYRRIFSRSVDAHRLFLLYRLSLAIDSVRNKLSAELRSSFSSVRLTLAHLISQTLDESELGQTLQEHPQRWLPAQSRAVDKALKRMATEVVDSVNYFVDAERQEKGEAFDPKTVFKSQQGVRKVEREVRRDSRRHAERDPSYLFKVKPKTKP
jgi:hypothetical protein